jgi:flagellar motor switch/type III secretory pathway protein FliN
MINAEQVNRYAGLPLEVVAELGRLKMPMRDVLALTEGSLLRLPVRSGSRIAVRVAGLPFAAGEVMRIGEAPAVRLLKFANE